ncbi:uncharacterized protein EI97DRAFT_434745 [Westerdykella ornata]|uniref:Uncharacterized protein n=1 Tax=Westerdykella ornata TaxID=318751 RepID=A0A6A6JDZ9_WESOR|nr:uncharacterized protein EI97DRAFT_434745 [Westerdykella ornata]KAF2274840.1 hypothetical protein EI97DRAFT_434745 [Westerdykella ornata]
MRQQRTKPDLQVRIHTTTKPFKSSYLAIPPSPFSPRTPLYQTTQGTSRTGTTRFFRSFPSTSSPASTTYPNTSIPSNFNNIPVVIPSPSPSPLRWLWQCHNCHRTYPLSVTRRCLEDGHFFCAGTTTLKCWRKSVNPRSGGRGNKARVLRHKACGSEFDYLGWKEWGRWRRGVLSVRSDAREASHDSDAGLSNGSSTSASLYSPSSSSASEEDSDSDTDTDVDSDYTTNSSTRGRPYTSSSNTTASRSLSAPALSIPKSNLPQRKNCWLNCDYPSECRWGRQYGVHTPLDVSFPVLPLSPPSPEKLEKKGRGEVREGVMKFGNICGSVNKFGVSKKGLTRSYDDEDGNGNGTPTVAGTGTSRMRSASRGSDLWTTLVASATRRKTLAAPSPLSRVEEEEKGVMEREEVGAGSYREQNERGGKKEGSKQEGGDGDVDAALFSAFIEEAAYMEETGGEEGLGSKESTTVRKDRDGDVFMTSPSASPPIPQPDIRSMELPISPTPSLSSTLSSLSSSVTAPVSTLRDIFKKTASSASARSSRSRSRSRSRTLRSNSLSNTACSDTNGTPPARHQLHTQHKRAKASATDFTTQPLLARTDMELHNGVDVDGESQPEQLAHPDILRLYSEEFAPLERVQSRDSGYMSSSSSL